MIPRGSAGLKRKVIDNRICVEFVCGPPFPSKMPFKFVLLCVLHNRVEASKDEKNSKAWSWSYIGSIMDWPGK